MIGKMYRPVKITTLHEKRGGFRFQHKYKSNFAGLYEFNQEVYLHYDQFNHVETIKIELQDLKVPVAVDPGQFEVVSETQSESFSSKRAVRSKRKIERPSKQQMTSTGDTLSVQMPIVSERLNEENEVLFVEIKPIVVENVEYMFISASADTQIEIISNTNIKTLQR